MQKILDIDNVKLCSVNDKYINKQYSLSENYKSFKLLIGIMAKKKMIEPPLSILIVMETALDIDNPVKPIFDGLQKIVFKNDSEIKKMEVLKRDIKKGTSGRLKMFAETLDIAAHNKTIDELFKL